MKRKENVISLTLALACFTLAGCNTPDLKSINKEEVISSMSLEDKAHFLIGTGMAGFSGNNAVIGATQSMVPGAAGTTYPLDSLGIPAIVLADGPAGLRINPTREGDKKTYYCTHFPIGTLLASTWNQELIEEVGKAVGNEVKEYGVDVLLAPALNIHRNPLCGRNFEYYSEDPIVSGKIAAAYVRGVQSNGVGTSIKHFVLNNQESNRMNTDARVSQRAMREIYLKGFEIAVKEGKPWTVMSSYNYINGTYASESKELQTTILRDEWGFDGLVMTDWFGGKDGAKQIAAGNDLLEPGKNEQFDSIVAGARSGKLSMEALNLCVNRVLQLVEKSPRYQGYKYSDKPDLRAHAAVTRQSATEGMVLLKNEGTLPIKNKKSIALYGNTSYDFIAGGTGSGNVNHAYVVSLLDGLKNAGFTVDTNLQKAYTDHVKVEKTKAEAEKEAKIKADSSYARIARFMPPALAPEFTISTADLQRQAKSSDIAVLTIGRISGEFADRKQNDFTLSAAEQALIKNVCDAFHAEGKKVVVLLNIGGVIETASWKNMPDAILCAWQGGQEGGNSVADILTGKVNPSGKLTMTWPIGLMDAYSTKNFPIDMNPDLDILSQGKGGNKKNWDYTNYEEDIFVGYRYFDSFNKEVSYPFGFGLSYTTFDYSDAKISNNGGNFTVSVKITNKGNVAGKEVVQLYVADPQSKVMNKPVKELKGFAKTKELSPSESQVVEIVVNTENLAYFDTKASAWVTNAGNYQFLVASSSCDVKATLEASVKATHKKVNNVLAPKHELNLLHR